MKRYRHELRGRKLTAIVVRGVLLAPLVGFELGEFTTTTTTTLGGEEVVTYLVRSPIVTPIDELLTDRIEGFFGDEDG